MGSSYYNLGTYQRKVTTNSAEAQTWFDRGLLWSYSFNHEESYRCFSRATEHDPQCAMAHWGIAYALGPNYNKVWGRYDKVDLASSLERGISALEKANELGVGAQPVERALIAALATRYPASKEAFPDDSSTLDGAYIEAMKRVYEDFKDDPDVPALYAEALMVSRSRRLWDLKTGEPTWPGTVEARQVIEASMASGPGRDHPANCHLYIHLMEMSPNPAVAQSAADRLRRLVPDGSHMQHMATHIDIASGDYRRGIDSNYDAMLSDDAYFAREKGSLIYTSYRAHNIRVMGYAAMMSGRSEHALLAARRLDEIVTSDLLRVESPKMVDWLEFQRSMMPHVLIRFGRWDDILNLPLPEDQQLLSITTASILYARAISLGVLGRLHEARTAQLAFLQAHDAIPADRVYSLSSTGRNVLQVGSLMLEGELAYREGDHETAFRLLRVAVEVEDDLPYADPPMWLQPVRHALGALLLEQDRVEEALEVYRQDLGFSSQAPARIARPNNVWGLQGLHESLVRLGRDDEARIVRKQYGIATASADVDVGVSCYCRLSKARVEPDCCS